MAEAILAFLGAGGGGGLAGNIVDALVKVLHLIAHYIVVALRWIKQGLYKVMHYTAMGIRQAIRFETKVVERGMYIMARNPRLAYGIAFALLFDYLNLNGV